MLLHFVIQRVWKRNMVAWQQKAFYRSKGLCLALLEGRLPWQPSAVIGKGQKLSEKLYRTKSKYLTIV